MIKSLPQLAFLSLIAVSLHAAENTRNSNKSSAAVLEEIVVSADRTDSFGADLVQAGTFRNARLLDTPLTINVVVPRAVLDAQAATGLYDALRNIAGVARSQLNGATYDNIAIRCILVENRGNYRLNGSLPVVNLIDLPLENKQRVEVLKSVSALYAARRRAHPQGHRRARGHRVAASGRRPHHAARGAGFQAEPGEQLATLRRRRHQRSRPTLDAMDRERCDARGIRPGRDRARPCVLAIPRLSPTAP